jgi:quinol monooxygenase YgiN
MSMLLTRAKVKAEKVADVEAGIKRLVPAFEQAHLNGRYAWFRLDDGVTFVILTEFEQGATPPPNVPEYQAFTEILKTAVDGKPTSEPLTVIESYHVF